MSSARAKQAQRLAELRRLRASGKTRLSTYEVEEDGDVYDEVDDEEYKKIIRRRLDQDDFVVDDNGIGYADDGREEWDDGRRYDDSDGSDAGDYRLTGKAAKRKREEDERKKEAIDDGIQKYFNRGDATIAKKPKPAATTAADEEFMASLLGEVDTNVPATTSSPAALKRNRSRTATKPETRRKVRIMSPPRSRRSLPIASSPPPVLPGSEDGGMDMDDESWLHRQDDDDDGVHMGGDMLPSSPVIKAVERKAMPSDDNDRANEAGGVGDAAEVQVRIKKEVEDEDDDIDMMAIQQVAAAPDVKPRSVNMAGSRPPPKIKQEHNPTSFSSPVRPTKDDDDIDASLWVDLNSKLNIISSPAPLTGHNSFGKVPAQDVVEEDGVLSFFWLDYVEVHGSLCLFGKVLNKKTGKHVSAFVKIDNILRKLYFLPRKTHLKLGRETDEEVSMEDVYLEVDSLMDRLKVKKHKIKPSTRKYAFELPDIPKEAEYLKLMYPYDAPPLSMDTTGTTFSHVFGANTALFEQFVLWKGIMGPCWLKVDGADFTTVNGASWCKVECSVENPASINPVPNPENQEPPKLTLMSLALRTQLNVKENKQEILVACARIYEDVSITDTTPADRLPCRTLTVMRPPSATYPVGFEAEVRKHRGTYKLEKNEKFLLSRFLALFEAIDPDVLMGHNLQEVDFNILLSRLRDQGTPGWHRIGRLRRSEWPKNFSKGASFFAERQLIAGRLVADLANDMGKSLMLKCQSWSLTEMTSLYLSGAANGNVVRMEIDTQDALAKWARSKEGLMNFVSHCETDTYFIAALVLKLQLLPLTRVLTNLAGNSWARTLSGTRAERNEYILLHEFYRNKYICPDKYSGRKAARSEEADDQDGNLDRKKKDKYKGGLVFEPEKGLYDKYVLVMDFNSLYPSIIQEFNICFTTVDRTSKGDDGDDEVPSVPEKQAQGILPRLIATLVNRRREVKKMMKSKSATSDELASWDTKQLALKLTANSMYGCLGYTQSRFYARPLAILITYKGREILGSTKALAEMNQLQVIYGDTDSVMINTHADTYEEAFKVGNTFKKAVNDQYRLLEIDIDNVFRRLLLHAKKKYAAINVTEKDGTFTDHLEVKGLDMKRREYCALSKEVSQTLLTEILSGEDPELVISKVHDHLKETADRMRAGEVPIQKYTMFTKLSKRPEEYPQKDTMPPVQVALRERARGKSVRPGDVIAYIVTTGENGESAANPAHRSYTLTDVLKKDSNLQPDIEFYLLKQIFPPVERLCAPIPGTDPVRLAECLGLDTRKYQIGSYSSSASTHNQGSMEVTPLESQIPDGIRFKDAARFNMRCRSCGATHIFEGLMESVEMCTPEGLQCPGCNARFSTLSITAQLECQIRAQTSAYYEGWLVCDECGLRTRSMSVYGHRCLGPRGQAEGCRGRMNYEYTEKRLYNQLLYLARIWDLSKVKTALSKETDAQKTEKVQALVAHNQERFDVIRDVVDAYLRKCGRQWVEMDQLFGFALK
ncbi:DNA-directed DNA polymerase alpha catalytic subunit pol1 [Ascosphaera acerosa]|nr:DNA-directed DNA polymerase alpha catalytic subunit pol1 [Ascosphaera acerosa]